MNTNDNHHLSPVKATTKATQNAPMHGDNTPLSHDNASPIEEAMALEDDNFGGIGITIGTNISPRERRLLAQGSVFAINDDENTDFALEETPYGGISLAQLLTNTRESLGLSIAEVSETTRVNSQYLEAFEKETYDVLPSRAFSIGYIKSYAKALGLDEETLADMFKRNFVEPNSTLKAPTGASLDDVKPNYNIYIFGAASLVAAIVIWNVFQRSPELFGKGQAQVPISDQTDKIGSTNIKDGVVYVSKPALAPKDQDIPEAYYTPGLEEGFASIDAEKRKDDKASQSTLESVQLRKAFNPRGAIYGAQPQDSSVTIQTKRGVNLVVKTTNGIVYFAKQLQAGEAYRVPQFTSQTTIIDVSDPRAFDVFYNGEYAGQMEAPLTPVAQLNSKAALTAKMLDAQAKARALQMAQTRAQAKSSQTSSSASENASSIAPVTDGPIPYQPAPAAATPEASPTPQ